MRLIAVMICFATGLINTSQAQFTVDQYTSGSGTFTVPVGVTEITVECIGGGGGGGRRTSNGAGGGGGGGAYASEVIAVTPLQQFVYTVGSGGSGNPGSNGNNSIFGVTLVVAEGGKGPGQNNATGGVGGSAANSTGTITRNGGNGATGVAGTANGGGGGGGAAGATDIGGSGGSPSVFSAGAGNAPGGNGGAGRTSSQGNGVATSAPGGGGGGGLRTSSSNRDGGSGAAGLIRISYTIVHCSGPTTDATNANLSPLNSASATLNWTSGDGTGGRIVVLRQGSAVNAIPIPDNTYTANPAFGSGAQLGTGNFVVYNGTGSSVNIQDLLPSTLYHYSIFEYNTVDICYSTTPLTGSFTTASCSPTIQASNFTFPCPGYNDITLNFNRGNGTNVLVLAKAGSAVDAAPVYNTSYTANAAFGSGQQLGTGNFVVYNGNVAGAASVPITGLNPNTTYHFRVYEYNASPNCYSTSPVTTSQATRNAGTYTSSTVAQVTTNVNPWTVDQQIVSLAVVVGGGTDAATVMNSITFNTNGSTNVANMSAAKIFYTGTSNTFSARTQFGSTISNPSGEHIVTGSLRLAPAGTHYFWVAYDIIESPVLGNAVDAQVTGFNLTDYSGTSNRTPSVANPGGVRTIANPSAPGGYCTPNARNGCQQGINIAGVNFAGNAYPVPCGNVYYNETAATPATVTPGQTYALVTNYTDGFLYSAISVWIDWNQNGTFQNGTNENVINELYTKNHTTSVTVPIDAVPGPTRMRVYVKNDEYNAPCGTSTLLSTTVGHVIDYTVFVTGGQVGAPVICLTPPPAVTNINYTQGDTPSQLSATGTGLLWYTAATGGTGLGTAPTPSTSAVGTTVYYVSSTDGCESTRSQIAVYVDQAPCAPSIDTDLSPETAACTSGVTSLSVAATNADTYQWQISTNGGSTWANLSNNTRYSGVSTATLNITNPPISFTGYQYQVIVSNGNGSATSAATTLAVQVCPSNNSPAPNNPALNNTSYIYPNCQLIQGTTLGATINPVTGDRDVWYQFTAISNGVCVRVGSTQIDPKIYLFDNNSYDTPLDVEDAVTGTGSEILNYGNLVQGNVYRIAVASANETDGNFNICIQKLRIPQCGSTSNLSLCSSFSSSSTGAANTLYSFTDGDENTTSIASAGLVSLGHPLLQLRYGASYNVSLTANYALQDGAGNPEPIQVSNNSACSFTTIAHPLSEVRSNQRCINGATLFRSSYLLATPIGAGSICGLTGYRVEFTPVSNCGGSSPQNLETFTKDIISSTASISLSYAFNQIPLVGNTAIGRWSVRWAPMFGSVVGTYGPAHVISVNGTAAPAMAAHNADAVAHASLNSQISATMYPNPNNGDLVNLNMTGITTPDVYLRIMDAMGREVYTNRFTVDGSLNTVVNFSKPLASGLYMVEFRSGNDVITQRMMVNK